jgi:ElaB/YqjD/DUF883 family membrane-anchored ribosome-binding protein
MAEKTDITKETPPETIRHDIERTREELSGTVNEIRDRLTPGHLKEHAKESFRETAAERAGRVKDAASRMGQNLGQAAKETGSTFMASVRNNPVPLGMIGAGIAWLLFNRTRNGARMAGQEPAFRAQAEQLTEQAQAKAGELSGQVMQTGSELAGKATESAERMSRAAQERARAATNSFQHMIHDNPLGMTIASFGIGALIGLIIPESRKEKEVMGSASETLMTRAKESAQKTIQKAQHAAEKAVQTAEEEFKKSAA